MEIIVFTDGSYIKHNNEEKCGYGIYFPNNELPNKARKFTHFPLTNQRAELYAIYKAIYYISKYLNIDRIKIYTDSKYSIGCYTDWIQKWEKNNWKTVNNKPVKNVDIIKKTLRLIKKFKGSIEMIHVKAHTNNNDLFSKYNDEADKLAKIGANLKN